MKKLVYFVAIATLAFVSCNKELEPANDVVNGKLTFKASIEQLAEPTKGTINADNQLVWAKNDMIGIYFPDWGDKNQPFKLDDADAGNTQGTFTIQTEANPTGANATAAFFPWNASGTFPSSTENNVYNGVMYFKLKNDVWGYDSGDMLTPLVASLSGNTDPINFKHAGAAIKLTINNISEGEYTTKLTVANEQITGDFHVNPANAGTDALTLDADKDVTKNYITLHSWAGGAFSWVFPVPALTTPKLSFEVVDYNGISVWSKSPKTQASVGRGEILVMPALSIKPYSQFSTDETWSVCGDHNSWGDTKMVSDGKLFIAKGVTFTANQQFKIRTTGAWTTSYGYDQLNGVLSGSDSKSKWHVNAVAGSENNNLKITTAGTYDIIFNASDSDYCGYKAHEIRVVQNGFPYPTPPLPKESAEITINGSFSDWDGITSESAGNTTVKVVSDDTNVNFFVQLTSVPSSVWGAGNYIYVLFDLDGDPSNDADQWGNKGDFIMLLYPYGGSSESPALITTPNSNWLCNPNTSPYTISNVSLDGTISDADGSGNRTVTYEFRIPRGNMPTIPSTAPITITFKGSPASKVSISRVL